MERITGAAAGNSLIEIASAEVSGIKARQGDKPCRLHVGGETANTTHAVMLAGAAEVYVSKHGQPVFTYTHNWRSIPRAAFGSISVLASCEYPEQVAEANALRYAAALLIPNFPNSFKVFRYGDTNVLPCRAAIDPTVKCHMPDPNKSCRLCMGDGMLRDRGLTIGLAIHGNKARELKQIVQ